MPQSTVKEQYAKTYFSNPPPKQHSTVHLHLIFLLIFVYIIHYTHICLFNPALEFVIAMARYDSPHDNEVDWYYKTVRLNLNIPEDKLPEYLTYEQFIYLINHCFNYFSTINRAPNGIYFGIDQLPVLLGNLFLLVNTGTID